MRLTGTTIILMLVLTAVGYAQTVQDRLKVLEAEIERLRQEVDALKGEAINSPEAQDGRPQAESSTKSTKRDFGEQILVPDLGADERKREFEGRPEIFLQTRFSQRPVPKTDDLERERNFQLTRIEVRWSGRLSSRIGAGLEMQFHPAADGSADEIVNDAFIEFYPAKALTLRAGQFVKPFGFDVQQSSSEREYPERAMFEGYFFPGERDRGVLLRWDGSDARHPAFRNTTISAALLNGNRFFNDSDGSLDGVFRIRRVLPEWGLAVGASAQFGSQILPPGITANHDSKLFGLDLQYAFRRFGTRLEVIRGTRPSSLLSRDPNSRLHFCRDRKPAVARSLVFFVLQTPINSMFDTTHCSAIP